jgi:hypothetical protein
MARVKGAAVQSSLRYVRERFGQAALDALCVHRGDAVCRFEGSWG